jgi:hypothetical protein
VSNRNILAIVTMTIMKNLISLIDLRRYDLDLKLCTYCIFFVGRIIGNAKCLSEN